MMQNNKYYQQKSPPDAVRIVIISDTHSRHRQMARAVPDGDILIHAGDFTNCGRVSEVQEFNDWFTSLPHPHKIVIAGNHEVPFDPKVRGRGRFQKATAHPELHKIKTFLDESKCVYLEDSAVEVAGIKFYGSPHQPAYGQGWAFNMERNSEEIRAKWAAIPDGTDILVTHGPPLGFLDQCSNGDRAGCEDLLREVIGRIKPKYHVFGHVHEGKTVFTPRGNEQKHLSLSCSARFSCDYSFAALFISGNK